MHIPRSADQVIERTIEEIPTLRVGQHRAWAQDIEATVVAMAGGTSNPDGSMDIPDSIAPAIFQPAFVSGRWYHAGMGAVKSGTAIGINSIKLYPFQVTRPVTITDLGARVNTLQAANNFQLAVYGANSTTHLPTGLPKAKTGNISTAVEGMFGATVGTAVALTPGVHWAAVICSNGSVTFMARDTASNEPGILIGSANINDMMGAGQLGAFFYSTPQTFGTWPDLTAAVLTAFFTAAQAALVFKVA